MLSGRVDVLAAYFDCTIIVDIVGKKNTGRYKKNSHLLFLSEVNRRRNSKNYCGFFFNMMKLIVEHILWTSRDQKVFDFMVTQSGLCLNWQVYTYPCSNVYLGSPTLYGLRITSNTY